MDRHQAGRDQSAVFDLSGLVVGPLLQFRLTFPGDSPGGRQSIGRFRLSVCAGDVPADLRPPREAKPPPHDVAFVVTESVPPFRMMVQGPDLFEKTYVLKRGDVDKKDGEATPGVLQVLSPAA